jgi:hypothetical protein
VYENPSLSSIAFLNRFNCTFRKRAKQTSNARRCRYATFDNNIQKLKEPKCRCLVILQINLARIRSTRRPSGAFAPMRANALRGLQANLNPIAIGRGSPLFLRSVDEGSTTRRMIVEPSNDCSPPGAAKESIVRRRVEPPPPTRSRFAPLRVGALGSIESKALDRRNDASISFSGAGQAGGSARGKVVRPLGLRSTPGPPLSAT